MKGIVLAGGIGSRLYPLTRVTNKHLLPVYDKPMIFYPLQTLVNAGIRDILIVTGGQNAGDFLRLLQNGKEFGLQQLSFAYQEGEAGIADALRLAEPWAKGDKICVVLGDNIIEGDVREAADRFQQLDKGAMVMLKEVNDPERFGVPVFENERIIRIEEKPKKPLSSFAVIGIYFYDGTSSTAFAASSLRAAASTRSPTSTTATSKKARCTMPCWMAGGPTPAPSNRCGMPATWCATKCCAAAKRSPRCVAHEITGHRRRRIYWLEFCSSDAGQAPGLEAGGARQADLRGQSQEP